MQLKYWNELDEYITNERNNKNILVAHSANISYLKLLFLISKIKELKKKNIKIANTQDDLNKGDPFHERQTVDIDIAEVDKKKGNKKSRYGSWAEERSI